MKQPIIPKRCPCIFLVESESMIMMATFRRGFTSCCDALEQRSAYTGSVTLKIEAVCSTETSGENISTIQYKTLPKRPYLVRHPP